MDVFWTQTQECRNLNGLTTDFDLGGCICVFQVTAAQIATMDIQIGRIYNALQDAAMLENCIIAFTS